MRFFTVKDGVAARRSVFWATLFVCAFALVAIVLGYGAIALILGNPSYVGSGGAVIGGGNMVVLHLAHAVGGEELLGLTSAVGFATILAVVAGLTLSAATAVSHDLYVNVFRRAGEPRLSLQVLAYPATDFSVEHPSWAALADQSPLTRARLRWFQKQYLRDDADRRDWRVSPLLAPNLKGVAPAFVATAGFDPMHDEGEAYLERLRAAGVSVRSRRFGGQIHGFIPMGKVVPEATILIGEIAAALDWAFQTTAYRSSP